MCVECHGAGGAGGDAPSLNRPRLSHAPDDTALANVIANGIPNTAMPRIRRFTESELRQLVAYVRSVGKLPTGTRSGRRQEGRRPLQDVSPARHATSSPARAATSVRISPTSDSTRGARICARRSSLLVRRCRRARCRCSLEVTPSTCPCASSPARAAKFAGSGSTKMRSAIQVRDAAGRFYSLRKSDLELLDKQTGKSVMPELLIAADAAGADRSRGVSRKPAGG